MLQESPMNTPNPITITPSAALRVGELLADEQDDSLCLRLSIEGGGCSGFQYGFVFDADIQEEDTIIDQKVEGAESGYTGPKIIRLLVDSTSVQYLTGSTIDFKDDLQGPRFIVKNPSATTTCGCGSSFSMEPDVGEEEEK